MPLLSVGEPTAMYLADSTSVMMSEMWLALRSNRRAGTPHSTNASTISRAMTSVVCHMLSYTTMAYSSGESELHSA